MGFSTDLLKGVAELLGDTTSAIWRPDGSAYGPAEIPIVLGSLPTSPDRALGLALYGAQQSSDDVAQADSMTGLQVRVRGRKGDTTIVDDLADEVFEQLQGLSDHTLSTGVHLLLVDRRIVAPLGMDGNGRYERADSYDLTVHRPSLYRIE
ncbi:MAG: minor capsid protein [Micromonosporaceae bacterium]